MYGERYSVESQGIIVSTNLIGKVATGSSVQMAVYTDNNNYPKDLIATSEIGIVDTGIVSLSVDPILLFPGEYWVMALYETIGKHTYFNNFDSTNITYGLPIEFGSPIPISTSNFVPVENVSVTYFLELDCMNVDAGNLIENKFFKIYPNPANTEIFIENNQMDKLDIEIFDVQGKKVKSNFSNTALIELSLSDLLKGVYFVRINGDVIQKIIRI